MEVLIQAAQFILSLSFLIVLHEMGHFLPAKWFGTRVERFYLFFNPWFSLYKKKIGETTYGIGWLPLGGYVKIAGMIDESMDREQMNKPAEPWEFRAKPAWQRLIIMIGGVTVNAILGMIIFAGVLWYWGEPYLPPQNMTYGVYVDSFGRDLGLQDGDQVLAIDGDELKSFEKLNYELLVNAGKSLTVKRNGETLTLPVPDGTIRQIVEEKIPAIAYVRMPNKIEAFPKEGGPAKEAGLQVDDQIVGINGQSTFYFHEFSKSKEEFKGKTVTLDVVRNADTIQIQAPIDTTGMVGYMPYGPDHYFDFDTTRYSMIGAIPAGVSKAYNSFVDYVKQIGLITSGEVSASKSVGGFITIGSIFSPEWDWYRFWTMTAWLSIILAFMNILPIPALDGGHVIFLLWEIISGKQPPQKVLEYSQMVGMVLLLALLVFANANDVMKLFGG